MKNISLFQGFINNELFEKRRGVPSFVDNETGP
jgi:hypothetical protein